MNCRFKEERHNGLYEHYCIHTCGPGKQDNEGGIKPAYRQSGQARKAGVPVISSSRDRGYYIAQSSSETDKLLREIWARIRSLLKTYWTLKKRLKLDGQMTLYEMEELFKVKSEVFEDE